MKSLRVFLYLFCVGILHVSNNEAAESVSKDLMVTNVDRTVDVASQLVKINTKLTLSNEGQSTLKFFHFVIEDGAFEKATYIGATVSIIKCIKKVKSTTLILLTPNYVF